MAQPNFLPSPFAASGDKNIIPQNDGGDGLASYEKGFPYVTELDPDAGGIAPDRLDFNGILNILSQFAIFMQQGGTFEYSPLQDYGKGALVTDGAANIYACKQANGPSSAVKPLSDGTYWKMIISGEDLAVFTGATAGAAGTKGLVPAPAAGDSVKYLLGDATWGKDPDVLAAIAAGQIGDIVTKTYTTPADLNNFKTSGIYLFTSGQASAGLNFPSVLTQWLIVIARKGGGLYKQIVLIVSSATIYERHYTSNTWSAWSNLYPQPAFTGATEGAAGTGGTVPAPQAGEQGKTLLASGAWGQDPDVKAAIEYGQIGYMVVNSALTNVDLDTYTTPGGYVFTSAQVSGGSHFPTTSGDTMLWVQAQSGGSPVKQIASPSSSVVFYVRYKVGSTWSAWVAVAGITPQAASGVGQWTAISGGSDGTPGDCNLPANGTWAYFAVQFTTLGNHELSYAVKVAGVDAGGTTVIAAAAGTYSVGFAWRIA